MNFYPDSILMNNIFIPFYHTPKKRLITGNDIEYETGFNGLSSVINLTVTQDEKDVELFPYIDLSKWHSDSNTWYWYSPRGFPYTMDYVTDTERQLNDAWGLIEYSGNLNVINKDDLFFEENSPKEIGIYTKAINDDNNEEVIFYQGTPISVVLQGIPLIDITDYSGRQSKPVLSPVNTDENKEFYYDFSTNRIYTNQNLDGYSPNDVKIYIYETVNDVSVKCRMSANTGGAAYTTPTVDYYILKLNGQHLKG